MSNGKLLGVLGIGIGVTALGVMLYNTFKTDTPTPEVSHDVDLGDLDVTEFDFGAFSISTGSMMVTVDGITIRQSVYECKISVQPPMADNTSAFVYRAWSPDALLIKVKSAFETSLTSDAYKTIYPEVLTALAKLDQFKE